MSSHPDQKKRVGVTLDEAIFEAIVVHTGTPPTQQQVVNAKLRIEAVMRAMQADFEGDDGPYAHIPRGGAPHAR